MRLRFTTKVGVFFRREFRRACMELNIKLEEDKGFFNSFFVAEGDEENIKALRNLLDRVD